MTRIIGVASWLCASSPIGNADIVRKPTRTPGSARISTEWHAADEHPAPIVWRHSRRRAPPGCRAGGGRASRSAPTSRRDRGEQREDEPSDRPAAAPPDRRAPACSGRCTPQQQGAAAATRSVRQQRWIGKEACASTRGIGFLRGPQGLDVGDELPQLIVLGSRVPQAGMPCARPSAIELKICASVSAVHPVHVAQARPHPAAGAAAMAAGAVHAHEQPAAPRPSPPGSCAQRIGRREPDRRRAGHGPDRRAHRRRGCRGRGRFASRPVAAGDGPPPQTGTCRRARSRSVRIVVIPTAAHQNCRSTCRISARLPCDHAIERRRQAPHRRGARPSRCRRRTASSGR